MPTPPALIQIDPNSIEQQAVAQDKSAYALSDKDWATRFPDLVKARNYAVNNSVANLNGTQDPLVASALTRSGLGGISFGDNDYKQARNLGVPILSKENRDRNYFQDLFKQNPERSFGLNSTDVSRIALANTGQKTEYDQAQFGSRINQINANAQQGQALTNAITKGISSAGGLASSFQNPSTQQNYTVGYNPSLAGPNYGQGYASYNLPTNDPDYGNSNYIGLGDTDTSGVAASSSGGGL